MNPSDGLAQLPECDGVINRRTFLPEKASGRRILHLGCVDEHLTASRVGTGDLLHEELTKTSTSLVGVDISKTGLEVIASLCPGEYVQGNVESMDLSQFEDIDLVIVAELIEHLGSPAMFYENLADFLRGNGATAILTTPNAYYWSAFLRFSLAQHELTHPDHRLYYSPTTLEKSLSEAGLVIHERYAHAWTGRPKSSPKSNAKNLLLDTADRLLYRNRPWLAPGLVWVVGGR